jgi:hypothetical protein
MYDRTMWQINKDRHAELLKVAGTSRLLKETLAGRPGNKARLFVNVGNFLISSGLRLKARYQPVTFGPPAPTQR